MDMKLDARRIKALRDQRAWSQEHLAVVAGLSTRTLQRIEAGATASHDTCLALASALEVSVATLAVASEKVGTDAEGAMAQRLPGWVMLAMLVVVSVIWFGYTIGKDMALRDNRADAACTQDTRACEGASTGISTR
jgi:transcriptional regulator with XRE-family HTH domain